MRYFTVMTNLARCNELSLSQRAKRFVCPAYGTNLLGIQKRCFKWYVKSFANNLKVAVDKWSMNRLVIDSIQMNEDKYFKRNKTKNKN